MSLIIHATITVTGDAADLAACRGQIERALNAAAIEGEAAEHHGERALCYDLKVKGGLPFPTLVDVSRAFPKVTVAIEWVNLEAGQRGAATIVAGGLAEKDIGVLDGQAQAPACVRVAPDGSIALALIVLRVGPDECRGYAVERGRDAVFRAVRDPGGAMELYATEGAAEWAVRWRTQRDTAGEAREALEPPQPIVEAEYLALERMAREFAAEWLWFAEDPETEVAIERERLKRRGGAECAANLRSIALARIERGGTGQGGALEYDTLPDEVRWVEKLLTRCWLSKA